MEIYKLEKSIENENIDLKVYMDQIRKIKEHLSHSLKKRKDLVVQMNYKGYIEERIEDLCKERSSEEADAAIEDLLAKNLNLHEEVRKLKREQEIHSVRICKFMEQKNQAKNDREMAQEDKRLLSTRLEEKENEIRHLLLQQVDLANQLNNANQEVFILRIENERLQNDLNTER